MSQRLNKRNESSRLFLVVCAILVCPAALAQTDDFPYCCPPGDFDSKVLVSFEAGTTRGRVDEIASDLGLQVSIFSPGSSTPRSIFCVPIGEEEALATLLSAFLEVRSAARTGTTCPSEVPTCPCCPCGFDCETSVNSVPPCDPGCVLDFDGDAFSDTCDLCTDTDDDGFGNPESEFDPLGIFQSQTCPEDNCPDVANEDQTDLDGDGVGDVCDRGLTVCHIPPGNPARAFSIMISPAAFPAHLAHGDYPGHCAVGARRGRAAESAPGNRSRARPRGSAGLEPE